MKFINTLLVLLFISISLSTKLHAQCDGSPQGEQLQVINPSFEGPPGAHITPNPWSTCNITPDTQPGSWGVNLPASEGNTYVGFVQGGPAWLEGASQALSGNMVAGVEYTFTVDLAITNSNQGGINPAPAQLVIHGANALCQRTELLWTSPVVNNLGWITYTVTFTPTQNYSHIYFSISGNSPQNSYILLDNITPIVPNLPSLDITSHINGMADGCSFIISGELSLPLADSIILTGAFIESPSQANINGVNFSQTLNFNVTGPQTIYARVYYVDPATGANACSYDSVIVEVSSPIIGYDIQNHCLNTTANFTDTSYVLGVGSITSWNWDLGDGTTSTSTNPSHTYASPGTYDVTLEIEDQNGCATTLTKQVVVHPLPVANFTMNNACNGQSTTFTSTATTGSGTIAQTLWDVQSDGTIDYTTTNAAHVYPSEGTFNITQIVVTDQGCRDTITQAITVYPLPVADFTFVNNCDNEAVTFNSTSTVSSGTIAQTLWDVQSDGTTDYTTANGSHVYPNDGTFNITHIAVTNQGCRDTVTQAVTVYPLPVADFTFVNNCDNEAVTFTSTSTVSSGTITQTLWDVQNDGTIDYTTANGSHVYPNDGTFNVTHIAVTNQGCRDTLTQAVTVYPLPAADFSFVNNCDNEAVTFTSEATVSSGTIAQTLWDVQNDGTIDYTTANGSHVYPNDGTFNVTHIAVTDQGCRDTVTQVITVYPLPVADFTFVNNCDDEAVTFTSTSSVSSGTIVQTLWDVQSDGTTDYTTANGSHVYPTDGTFNITHIAVTDQGCRDTVTQAITVYPLPVADFTFVNNCDNEAVTFTSTSNVSSGTIAQTLWDVQNDGTIDYTTANGSHVYPTDGTFNVTHIVVTDQGCRDTVTQAITVYPLPAADFSFVNNCDNEAVTFTSEATASSGTIAQTLWDVQTDGTIDYTTANGSHVYPNDGTFNVTHIAVTDQGCRDTVTQAITVYPLPVADFTFVNNCDNEAVTFTSTSSVSSGTIVQTLWDVQSDGTMDYTTANGSHVYPTDGTFNITHIAVTDQGCRDTVTQAITVYPLPVADFTFVNNCDNEAVTFTSTSNVSSGTIAQTLWDVQNDGTIDYTTANGSHVYPTDGTFNVTHIVVTDQGCRDTVTQAITVYPLPAADFSFVNNCDNEAVTFTSEATVSSGTIAQTLWDVQTDGTIDYTTANGSHVYPNDGTFNVTHIAVTNNGCRDTLMQVITVSPLPSADFSFVNNCDNEAVTFASEATVSSGTIAQTLWDVQNDGTMDYTTANGSHVYPTDGTFNVTHIVVTDQGCRDTVTQAILVYPLPVADWAAASVCEGNQTVFNDQSTVTVLDNDAIVQWQWLFGDGGSSTAQNPTHTYNAENVYTGQLIVTTNHGCKDTFNTTATVWPLPQVNFSPTDVCLEFLTNFQDLSVISNDHTPNTNVQWNWNFADPAGGTSTLQNPSYAYQQDGVFNVQLEVTSANGCVNSATIPVTVHPKPQASFGGINLSGCAPICAELTSTSIVNNPSSIVRYTWTLSDGTVYNSSSPTATFCLENETDSTVYYDVLLTVETEQGCVDSYSEQNYIAVYHNPVASFYANPGQVSTVDETTELVNESLYADSYLWNFGDGSPASTSVNPTHSFPNEQGGSYTITLIASTNEGCRDTTFITIELLDELIFYIPNTFTPDGDIYNQTFLPVFTAGYDKYDYTLYIFNRWGEMVFESHDASIGWDGTYGGQQCQQGTYTWKIEVKTLLNDARKSFVGHINLLR